MEDVMRNALLTTVAAIGLFAGANIAEAQTPAEPRKDQPATSQQEQKAPRAGAEEKSEDKSKAAQEKSKPSSEKAAQETAKPAEGRAADEKTKPASEKAAQEETKPSENKAKAAEGKAPEEKAKPAGEKAAQDQAKPADNKGKAPEGKSAEEKAKPASEKAAQDQAKPTENKAKTADEKANSDKAKPVDKADTAKPDDKKAAQGKEGNSDKAADAKSGAAASSVAPEKQAKIGEVLAKEKAEPVTNVNFTISVGVSVPESVHVRPLPDEIVTIVPEYRGYDYVVVEEEIVIIEPRTRKIVVTIPRHGSRSASVSTTSTRIDLAPEKRKLIREIVMRERVKPVGDQIEITVGNEIPRDVEVHKFSETIYSDVPELRSYEYFVRSNDVVLVRDRKIVEVIN
jgi:uncharacterized protein DUF1236